MTFDEQHGWVERGAPGVHSSAVVRDVEAELRALARLAFRADRLGSQSVLWEWVRPAPDREELHAARAALRARSDRYEDKRWLASQRNRREERA